MVELDKDLAQFLPKEIQGIKEKKRKTVAFYGKGGIGKSTTSCNVSASLSEMGERVMQVGCDPKRDSISMLCHGMKPTILHTMMERGESGISEDLVKSVVHNGFANVLCVESGGPKPGVGCGGRGVNLALTALDRYKIFDQYDVTFLLLDVLGDTVCGGFAQPLRSGFAKQVYIVTCGEPLTLYQMNNLGKAVNNVRLTGQDVGVAGLIDNQRGIINEEKIVEEVADIMGVPVTAHIPRSELIQRGELLGQCVLEAFPDSDLVNIYRSLAKKILENEKTYIPKNVPLRTIKEIVKKYTGKSVVAV